MDIRSGKDIGLQLYYNFFDKFCDVSEIEELEMNTCSVYLARAEENLYDCIQPDKRAAWEKRGKMTAETLSGQMQNLISFLWRVAVSILKNDEKEPVLLKEEFR